ncbi:hypothetical protein As57867_006436, partial [Aphanomyces stellatus]
GYTANTLDDTAASGGILRLDVEELALLRLDETALIKNKSVARGAYGEVFLGQYKGETVAIKCLLPGKNSATDVKFLIEEIKITHQLDCPYIVKTLGASWQTISSIEMVVEWMDKGDLKNVLDQTKSATPQENSTTFTWREKIESLLCISEGLVYLHSLDIIHRDLTFCSILS